MKSVFQYLWQSIKQYKFYYLIMILAPVIGALYKPIVYYVIKMMVDTISTTKDLKFSYLLIPFVLYVVSDIILSIIWRLSTIASYKSEPYVKRNIILTALNTVVSFRYSFFQNITTGSIVSKIKGLNDGYTELWEQLWYGITYWILSSIMIVVSIFWVNWQLGSIILFWSVLFLGINYFFTQKINMLNKLVSDAKHDIIGAISDNISNIQSIKLFSSRNYEIKQLANQINDDLIIKEVRLTKFQNIVDIFNDIMAIIFISLVIVSMIKLKQLNQITTGDFVFVFSMIFQLQENLWHFVQEFHKLSHRIGDLKSSLTILDADINEYQDSLNVNDNHPKDNNQLSLAIEFRNINFNYNNTTKQIFNNFNLKVLPCERIGIVGYTGTGKTTLTNLLLKVFTPQSGAILINNIDIKDIDNDKLRQQIAVIPQDINLFHRSIMDNIRYGRFDATDEEVIKASVLAHADDFIRLLPDGYQTLVGERGVKLSGGQRQRIAIARAMLKNAPILILDEATSSLDSITEKYIQEGISQVLVGKTVLAIAHRLSTLQDMTKLIVIDQGEIVEFGSHAQLLAKKNSIYAKIWHTQYAVDEE
jgi:ATP-binding cassette subfamily B protein